MIEIWILTLVLLDPSVMMVMPVKSKAECEELCEIVAKSDAVVGRSPITACSATHIFDEEPK